MLSKTHLLNAAGTRAYSVELPQPIRVMLADYQDKTRQVVISCHMANPGTPVKQPANRR